MAQTPKALASMIVRYAKAHGTVERYDAWEGEGHCKTGEEKNEYEAAHDDIVELRYLIADAIGVEVSDLEPT
jgi:hypothetical protein